MRDVLGSITREALAASRGGPPVLTAAVVQPGAWEGVEAGARLLVRRDGSTLGSLGAPALDAAVRSSAEEALARRVAETVYLLPPDARQVTRSEGGEGAAAVLLEVVEASATLLVVGAGHIGQMLCRFGAELGLRVVVLDDRVDYANSDRLPEAEGVICGEFAEELDRFPIDGSVYVVLVTRGHKQDELSLRHVVGRGAAYLGMIGSKRRTAAVLDHLEADGFRREHLDAVHTPIGLDIGAETPAEIAVSILAEIILARRGGSGSRMYYRKGQVQIASGR